MSPAVGPFAQTPRDASFKRGRRSIGAVLLATVFALDVTKPLQVNRKYMIDSTAVLCNSWLITTVINQPRTTQGQLRSLITVLQILQNLPIPGYRQTVARVLQAIGVATMRLTPITQA